MSSTATAISAIIAVEPSDKIEKKERDNLIKERLCKEKESEVQKERKSHSTEQDIKTTTDSSTATTNNVITTAELLDKTDINNFTATIPTIISKFDAEKTKIFTPERQK